MITVAYLVLLLVIVSELNVIKGYDNIFPVDEVSDCKTRVLAAAQKKCRTNKVCKDGSIDMIQECGVLGYNLIFQDSTYDLNSDFEVHDAAHCAIKSCIEGMQSKAKNIVDLNLSGIADSLHSCLVAVKDCAKPKIKWHKYEL